MSSSADAFFCALGAGAGVGRCAALLRAAARHLPGAASANSCSFTLVICGRAFFQRGRALFPRGGVALRFAALRRGGSRLLGLFVLAGKEVFLRTVMFRGSGTGFLAAQQSFQARLEPPEQRFIF
ncbi:MAG: hypothetical protein ACR2OZ_05010 [Verrucomicrobiales bacterium]